MAGQGTLSFEEREVISREIACGRSARVIAGLLGRHHSIVSREIKNNGGRDQYRAVFADRRAEVLRQRPKKRVLEDNERLHDYVREGLALKWSPQQISSRLLVDYPDDMDMRVSAETIYQTLYLQARGELRTELKLALRTGRTRRVSRSRTSQSSTAGQIKDKILISERPAVADDRAVPGFWEGDLILGKGNKSQIATLVERRTRFLILVMIPYDRTAERVAARLARKMASLPEFLKNSLTWDQGKELAAHAKFTVLTDMPVYFCDPHSPWQRGTNENTNGLLRQYFPKGTDLSGFTQADLDRVAAELNDRPRETLGWMKPAEKLNELLLNAGVAPTT